MTLITRLRTPACVTSDAYACDPVTWQRGVPVVISDFTELGADQTRHLLHHMVLCSACPVVVHDASAAGLRAELARPPEPVPAPGGAALQSVLRRDRG